MRTSESIAKIAPALAAAQAKMGAAIKGSANPFFKSKYADLGAVVEVCKEPLNASGITILQPVETDEQGTPWVETLLLHSSGEFVSSKMRVVVAKQNDPQALGSAITYARRYSLQALLGIPAEDDDGEGAMSRNGGKASKQATKGGSGQHGDPRDIAGESVPTRREITGKVSVFAAFPGGSEKRKWTRYTGKIGDVEVTTFDDALAGKADDCYDQDAIAEIEEGVKNGREYRKLLSLQASAPFGEEEPNAVSKRDTAGMMF